MQFRSNEFQGSEVVGVSKLREYLEVDYTNSMLWPTHLCLLTYELERYFRGITSNPASMSFRAIVSSISRFTLLSFVISENKKEFIDNFSVIKNGINDALISAWENFETSGVLQADAGAIARLTKDYGGLISRSTDFDTIKFNIISLLKRSLHPFCGVRDTDKIKTLLKAESIRNLFYAHLFGAIHLYSEMPGGYLPAELDAFLTSLAVRHRSWTIGESARVDGARAELLSIDSLADDVVVLHDLITPVPAVATPIRMFDVSQERSPINTPPHVKAPKTPSTVALSATKFDRAPGGHTGKLDLTRPVPSSPHASVRMFDKAPEPRKSKLNPAAKPYPHPETSLDRSVMIPCSAA